MLYVNPLSGTQSGPMAGPETPDRRRKALQEFEHLLAFQLLKEMRKTVPEDPLFGSSIASDYYKELMDDFIAGQMASSGQLGVAELMEAQLTRSDKALAGQGLPQAAPPAAGSPLELFQSSRIPAMMPINTPVASASALQRAES